MIARLALLLLFVPLPTAQYGHHDQALLPDPAVTPGLARTTDVHAVCDGGSTKQFRHTTEATKKAVCLAYGLDPHCEGKDKNEIDHLISLELGGADDPKNLWPQPYFQHPGAHEKDKLEDYLHYQVCADKIDLAEAQRKISGDWYEAYLEMMSGKL